MTPKKTRTSRTSRRSRGRAESGVAANPVEPPQACRVCGRPLPPYRGRGRPSELCPTPEGKDRSNCARIVSRVHEIDRLATSLVEEIEDRGGDSEEARRSLQAVKAFLWSAANSATNRGKLVQSYPGKRRYRKKRSGWRGLADPR